MTATTSRTAALQALRPSRTDGLPPPPSRRQPDEPPGFGSTSFPARPAELSPPSSDEATFRLDQLLEDPSGTCRRMAQIREDMPARPLNVDLTPETARAFSDRCRALRVHKKDVIEVLLRAWLETAAVTE